MKFEIEGFDEFVNSGEYRAALALPEKRTETYELLAYGEYNINFVFTNPLSGERLVLRVNSESQAHLPDQIGYEANALRLLERSGRTPVLRYVDNSARCLEHGALVMSFVAGETFVYGDADELRAVAECLADIHSLYVEPDSGLISPGNPWRAMLQECEQMFSEYCSSPARDLTVERRLRRLLDEGWRRVSDKGDYTGYCCCINTDLNNTNFLVDRSGGVPRVSLVDWEKPLYGDPAQDLGHLLTPTTTFWKTDVIFDDETISGFIDDYIAAVDGRFDVEGLRERTKEFIVITCLRGMTWCAMGWVRYHDADKMIMNESTRVKLDAYLSDRFISRIEEIFGIG